MNLQSPSSAIKGRTPAPGHARSTAVFAKMVCALLAASTAWAGSSPTNLLDLSLEQLLDVRVEKVFGASKYEQKVTQAPASVSIITADDIKKFGYRTLADALKSVRGLYVSDDRNYSYLGIRGFLRPGDYNTRVLLLVDGHRVNESVYDSFYIGQDALVDVDLIERIEVIRGPSSSIYGSSAFFGVINIITRRGREINGTEVSVEGGTGDTYKGRFSGGKKFENGIEWLASGSYYVSDGMDRIYYPEFDQRISPSPLATNNGVARGLDTEQALNVFSSVSYGELTLQGALNYREKKVPTASYGTLFNDDEKTTDYRGYVDLKYDHAFTDNVRLMARVFYDDYRYYGEYPYNYADPGDPVARVLYKDEAIGQFAGTEWQLDARFLDRHTLVLGGEYRENFHLHQFNYDDYDNAPRFYYLRDDSSSRVLGVFAQGEVVIVTNLALTAGVRYDHYFESFGGTLNPRAGLIYNPWEGGTLKALYGQAYRAPNAYEQFYSSAQRARPQLDPEKIRTYELVYEQYFARRYRVGISGYYYEVDDLIDQRLASSTEIYFDNLAGVRALGVEFEAEAKLDCGLMARGSYAVQRAENSETGDELTSSPGHLAKFNLAVPLYKQNIFAGFELQYQSEAATLRRRHAEDFVVANFTLFSRELIKGLEFSGSVYNLFDTKYGYPGAGDHLQDVLQQSGRSFRIKLTYRF